MQKGHPLWDALYFCSLIIPSLEGEAYLRVDAAIVSRIAGAKTAETAGRRSGLAKQQRTQIANRVSKIGVVKYVVKVQRERQTIAATGV
ncbi:MAG TPA: hypothetical protein VJ372_00650, partial [Pyrinomonadaceae bacterium]|nr:hypothetical protein [Pyrinomonadaceae bacterium]